MSVCVLEEEEMTSVEMSYKKECYQEAVDDEYETDHVNSSDFVNIEMCNKCDKVSNLL